MSETYYDPEQAPDPKEWLALDEHERVRLAKNHHIAARTKLPNLKAHALFHVVVENQIAQGYGPTCRTVERLKKEGLSRHDAIHAVGSVIAEFVHDSMQTGTGDGQREMNARIEALSASSWKERGEREG